MSDQGDQAGDAALWQRWRLQARPATEAAALDLAAYAEGRLDESQAAPVEDWLFTQPEALAELAAARAAAEAEARPEAPEGLIARAAALVETPSATVVLFRRAAAPPLPSWRMAVAWAGIAASLFATSMVGFSIGNSAYLNFAGTGQPAVESPLRELLDPPSAIFGDEEEPAT
jgi:anti-sigma factor RsiW